MRFPTHEAIVAPCSIVGQLSARDASMDKAEWDDRRLTYSRFVTVIGLCVGHALAILALLGLFFI